MWLFCHHTGSIGIAAFHRIQPPVAFVIRLVLGAVSFTVMGQLIQKL